MSSYEIAVLPGDGIGTEVMPEALRVLDAVRAEYGTEFRYRHFDWSCETYRETGRMMPADGIDRLRDHDSILLGAVGYPGVPDHVSLWGLLLPIRREFDQYVNLRPVRLLPGVTPPVRDKAPGDIDFWVVRENTEGEYSRLGGRQGEGTPAEMVLQTAVFTRHGTDRILRYAFEFAERIGKPHVTSGTKSNGIYHSMPYWDERFRAIAAEHPQVAVDQDHIDILCARFVMSPERFDVVVASNLFGDILSDLGPGVTGTIGVAPSGNINPERRFPSTFEPVHGSAPDIAGRGVANPIGQIWSAAMMLDHLGEQDAAADVVRAIESVLAAGAVRTPDLGGSASTADLGKAIAAEIGAA
ncbi:MULTISPECIES: tartrate dehydrogenase [unclassified Saccharopolyspora]|uniref:tartrate dehydrogenase n=1 Tax=unclassified Saccharopolyspora TaxID=2646250 RepID=UPI001CD65390|nr:MULTISPECIES: tartrate dehydrogenase [unclassified Saccharopolyspora]MCA1187180.1 tartrate dehydrogenase [Saccharopolyspora sp. 6T]MCA1195817.1 tartrate dehydrogenase [Saccharopolyspora sp. 6V]MCA1228086.1 tartrate dehydrogenase [Saccharopolyspora sp. 6M]MCA1282445.1 tartrate dehydrogenase [Saccharopolyspora sp. 7B]